MAIDKTAEQLQAEITELQFQLEEANDTLDAIRTGMVDAFVVHGTEGHEIYTLKTADQTYRVWIERMGEGAITLDKEGFILYSNPRFADMVGIPLNHVIGKHLGVFLDADRLKKIDEVIHLNKLSDWKTEAMLVQHDQTLLPVLLTLTAMNLDDGTALSILLTDLSEQKQTENLLKQNNEALQEARNEALKLNNELENTVAVRTKDLTVSREHFMMLSNNIPHITWTNLPNGEVNFFNERWYEYTGLSKSGNIDQILQAVVHADDVELTRARYRNAIQTGQILELENRYLRTDGVYRWHLTRSTPLKNESGDILFWVGTATDIDDQRKAIEKKDEFISIASHELKTPLTSLKAYLQLIANFNLEPIPERVKSFIGKADSSMNKLHTLVNDLLDFSKIQAGKLDFSQNPVHVNDLVAACVENARYMFPQHNIIFSPGLDYLVKGNMERLEQVLMNLINNAVKYAPDSREIILSSSLTQGQVKISVTDFGIGLSANQQEKIFERFYRVEDKNYMASGLGMGLYISMEIIKSHLGTMGVESKLNEGSTFYILLKPINSEMQADNALSIG
jgi:two-component system phosphate regulon sensor histidine kinase PhoR